MPNHIHFTTRYSIDFALVDMMRDFKRHLVRQINRELQVRENEKSLSILGHINIDARQEYDVWEDDYDGRDVFSAESFKYKMDYIHWNPCQMQ